MRITVMAGPTSYYTARVEVGIMGKPTPITTEHFPTTESLYRPAGGASERGVRRGDQLNPDSYQRGKKRSAFCKEPRCMLLVSQESLRVLKRNASASSQCHGHQFSGFMSEHLSLRGLTAEVMGLALSLTFGRPFFLFLQDGAEVRPTVSIRSGHCCSYAHVIPVPFFGFVGFGQRTADVDNGVPLALAAHDLGGLAQLCSRMLQGPVECPVLLGWQVELAVSAKPFDVYPKIKAGGLPGLLHLCGITKLSVQVGQFHRFGAPLLLESFGRLSGPFVISGGPVTYSLLELTFTCLRLAFERKFSFLGHHGIQKINLGVVLALKVTTKHTQQVGLDPGRVELDTISQSKSLVWGVLHSANNILMKGRKISPASCEVIGSPHRCGYNARERDTNSLAKLAH